MPEMNHLVVKLVNAFEIIDQNEDGYTDRSEADLPSILIFLPGIYEIEELFMCLTDDTLRLVASVLPFYNFNIIYIYFCLCLE